MSTSTKIAITILGILVLISLGLNVFLIWQLRQVQQQAHRVVSEFGPALQQSLNETIAELEDLEQSSLEFEIEVNQNFPVKTEVAFDEMVEVPVSLSVPISQVVETTALIDPLQTGIEIPVDVAVPVDVEIPINQTITIPLNQTIPIAADIPLDVTVPLTIDIGETDLAGHIARFREGLISLNNFVDQVLGGVQ